MFYGPCILYREIAMYSLLPFILILLSLAVIVFVIIRKFPQLTLLDVDSIPEVKMERKKDEILRKRVEERMGIWGKKQEKFWKPFFRWLKRIQLSFRKYVGRVQKVVVDSERKLKKQRVSTSETRAEAAGFLREAGAAFEQKDWELAEKKYIEVIRLSPRNREAYFGLGNVYLEKGELEDAEEAFQYLVRLNPRHDGGLVKLAEIAEKRGNVEKAIEYYDKSLLLEDSKAPRFMKIAELLLSIDKASTALEAVKQAVELEPENPRYLDMLAEVSIKCGDKQSAEDAFQKLRMANPENQKLEVLRERIEKMS